MSKSHVVIGGGIVGVSTALYLLRAGLSVTLIDRMQEEKASVGNAGVLARCSVVPVTTPTLLKKAPGMLTSPNSPLFMRWSYLPAMLPWLTRYLGHAKAKSASATAAGLAPLTSDSVDQHRALAGNSEAATCIEDTDYVFAYEDRAAFEDDGFTWGLRRKANFDPILIEGGEVADYDPVLKGFGTLAIMKDHGRIKNPPRYLKELHALFQSSGGTILQAEVSDFEISSGRVAAIETSAGRIPCRAAVLCGGTFSKLLTRKLGLNMPMESERGYHVEFQGANMVPRNPVMIAAGKFIIHPMEQALRCAGIVEFGGLKAGPSKRPPKVLTNIVSRFFPDLSWQSQKTWLGHRPATIDSLPFIGEVSSVRNLFCAFGHHHIGLTAGPKTGRIVADLVQRKPVDIDLVPYRLDRFSNFTSGSRILPN